MPAQITGHTSFEVQQRTEHSVLVAGLLLVERVLPVGNHLYRPTQVDDPVEPNLVPIAGDFLDAEAGLIIAQRGTVMAVGAAQ